MYLVGKAPEKQLISLACILLMQSLPEAGVALSAASQWVCLFAKSSRASALI